jgi:ATP-binding cassette subfamily F protein uup
MNYLQAENISKSFGDLQLFEDLSFSIDRNQKIALIARNGSGKSTLLRILAGNEPADEGLVSCKNDLTIGYLPQEPELDDKLIALDQVMMNIPDLSEAIHRYEKALTGNNGDDLEKAIMDMDRLSAWDLESRVKEVLSKLKILDFEQPVKHLSGGQRKRVALAQVLVYQPDLFILDEPTNHLDLDMIEWLEEYLGQNHMTLVMVTHDRYFLDRVCTDILEIANKKIYKYRGNYLQYLALREERLLLEERKADKAASLMKKELEWVRRMPKARGTKPRFRIEAFSRLKNDAKKEYEAEQDDIQIESLRLGKKVLEIEGLTKTFGDKILFRNFRYNFERFERIGLVGPNGVGKSTFLKIITGQMKADGGKAIPGETVRFGFYEQEGINFNPEDKVIDMVKEIAEVVHLGKGRSMSASQFLEYFLFSPEMQYNYVSKLSGGEKRRLYLCTVLMRNPNFIILDEPTNDLDIMTLNVLEDYLLRFRGCVMLVSHDRYFMDKVVDHLFVFEGNGIIRDFPGNYSIYRDSIRLKEETDRKTDEKRHDGKTREKPKINLPKIKLTYKEKLEMQQLEKDIESLESEKSRLENELSSGNNTPAQLQEKSHRISEILELLNEKEMRWLELSEFQNPSQALT